MKYLKVGNELNEKKQQILNCGKELFRLKGFKDTNISEITKMAGMATGTFYNYYTSKDKLFMEIFLQENVKLKEKIMDEININENPLEVMAKMMYLNTIGMQSNPILKEWYNRESFSRIEKLYREENGIEQVDFMYDSFIEIIRRWQAQGKIRNDIDADMIMAIFSALINVDTHKEDIGLKYFPKVMEYLAEFIMKGLTEKE